MIETLPKDWSKHLENEVSSPYFQSLMRFLEEEYSSGFSIFPEKDQLFNAFKYCVFEEVKVVILGQDPYPTPGHANGLCFSVNPGVALPKSLKNIFTELGNDLNIIPPTDGDLTRWAKQGVLLLNTVLSVRSGQPNSHKNRGWERFTDSVISTLSQKHSGLVFLLWGKPAQQKAALIDAENHHILRAPHPSPLSAYRGFIGSGHFSKTNQLLALAGKPTIEW